MSEYGLPTNIPVHCLEAVAELKIILEESEKK